MSSILADRTLAFFGVLIPIVSTLAFFGLIFAIFYFRHRERMAWLERSRTTGDDLPPPGVNDPFRHSYRDHGPYAAYPLRHALRLVGVGVGLSLGLVTLGFGPWLLGGLIPLFIGLVRLAVLLLSPEGPREEVSPQILRHWLVQGLTTLAVGLALLVGLATLGSGPWLLAGGVVSGVGLSDLLSYRLYRAP